MQKGIALLITIIILFFADNNTASYSLSNGADNIALFKIEGPINPVVAEYIEDGFKDITLNGFYAAIIAIDTPGGLDTSMRIIVKTLLNTNIPVIVYVSPSGARAASAGTFISYASHIAVMAPGTNIGAAHPVGVGPGKSDDTVMKKVENDAAAYIVSIASKRKRNKKWAEDAVRKSVSISEIEAKEKNVIDFVASDMDELLGKLDGFKLSFNDKKMALDLKGKKIIQIKMTVRQEILNTITDPNVAYILMLLGMVGLYFELATPGAILPGIIGAISLILAFYAFQTLPINYAGLLLIILGMLMFVAEIKVISNGILTIGGIASVILGSLLLMNRDTPYLRISWAVILPSTAAFALFISFAMIYALKAGKRTPMGGLEGIVGEEGITLTTCIPKGKAMVHGEIWNVYSDEDIKAGEDIVVTKIEGLTLKIKKSNKFKEEL